MVSSYELLEIKNWFVGLRVKEIQMKREWKSYQHRVCIKEILLVLSKISDLCSLVWNFTGFWMCKEKLPQDNWFACALLWKKKWLILWLLCSVSLWKYFGNQLFRSSVQSKKNNCAIAVTVRSNEPYVTSFSDFKN